MIVPSGSSASIVPVIAVSSRQKRKGTSFRISAASRKTGKSSERCIRATASEGGRVRADIVSDLPAPGRGVSRYDLDARLAEAVRAVGVDIRESHRVLSVDDDAERVTVSTTRDGEVRGDALVLATGRLARPRGDQQYDRA